MSTTNQKECANKDCNFAKVTLLLGDVWNILIIHQLLQNDELRFGELLEKISGLSNSVLSARLKVLLEENIVHRQSIASMPPQVIYSLTAKGLSLKPIFEEMQKFQSCD